MRSLPKPGARRAARRAELATYTPRFELARGADPWDPASGLGAPPSSIAPLDTHELRMLGLAQETVDSGYQIMVHW